MGLAFLALGAVRLAAIKMPVREDGLGTRQVHLAHLATHHIFDLGGAGALIFGMALVTPFHRPKEQINAQGQ
jgi:hypothetical protein